MEISLVEGKKKAKLLFYHISRFWVTCDSLAPILGGKKIKCLGFLILNKAQQHRATSGCRTRNEAEILADIWCQILIRGNQPPDQGDSLWPSHSQEKTWKTMFDTGCPAGFHGRNWNCLWRVSRMGISSSEGTELRGFQWGWLHLMFTAQNHSRFSIRDLNQGF